MQMLCYSICIHALSCCNWLFSICMRNRAIMKTVNIYMYVYTGLYRYKPVYTWTGRYSTSKHVYSMEYCCWSLQNLLLLCQLCACRSSQGSLMKPSPWNPCHVFPLFQGFTCVDMKDSGCSPCALDVLPWLMLWRKSHKTACRDRETRS